MPVEITRRSFGITAGLAASALFLNKGYSAESEKPLHILNPERLKPVDLRKFMGYGISHIYNGALDRRYNFMPFVRFNLEDPAPNAIHIAWGCPHMAGRFADALSVCAPIIEFEQDKEADLALRKYLHDCLDNKFCMPFHITLNPSDPENKNGWIHNCREVLLGLLGFARRNGDEESLALAKKFVLAIDKATRETGTFPSGAISTDGWGAFTKDELNMTSGRLIRTMIEYYRETKDNLGIDLARRFADVNIRETFTPDGGLKPESGNHLHSTQGTMTGLLDLGFETGDTRYSEIGRKLYENGLKPWRTSYGWAKEYKTYDDKTNWHYDSGEANNTADYIESALLLGKHFDTSYFDDAESFVRNGLLAAQLLDTDWIEQSGEKDTIDTVYSNMRNRAHGAFVFTTPNGYKHYHTDLIGGALQGLAETYNSIVTDNRNGVQVNMLFPCELSGLKIESGIPEKDMFKISVMKDTPVKVKLPGWLGKDTLRVNLNGNKFEKYSEKNGILDLGQMKINDKIEISFIQSMFKTKEGAPGYDTLFDIEWKGGTITGMKPLPENGVALYG